MSFFIMLVAAVAQTADPSVAAARRMPFTTQVNHPVGVEASSFARSIIEGGLEVPRTYDGELAVMGNVLSVKHNAKMEIAVLTTGNSPYHLIAHIATDSHLKAGTFVGIACKKADGTERVAIVLECTLISAPGMPAASMTFTPAAD